MKDYSGTIFAEMLLLLGLIVFLSERGRLVWAALLGQVTVSQGEKPEGISGVKQFTPFGLILAAFLILQTGKGAWGYAWVWILGSMAAAGIVINYEKVLKLFFGKSYQV